ncbi:MAG: thiamine phosphate synthase, partial [Bacteroidota bacterium]
TFFQQGLERLHLRKPLYSEAEHAEYLNQFTPEELERIVIHQYYDQSLRFPVRGIHLKERDRIKCLEKPAWFAGYHIVSAAFHDPVALMNHRQWLEYAFISPVFDSISKTGYSSPFQEMDWATLNEFSRFPVIALGGVDSDKMEFLQAQQFAGVAVLGAIWQAPDPLTAFADFIPHHS